MTSHICRIICECDETLLSELIKKWWKEEDYSKKVLREDNLPKRFLGNFRMKHYRGESRVHFDFGMENKGSQRILKINILFPDWSPLYPHGTLQDIACWFISKLKERNIKIEIKQGLFAKKIKCR